MGHLRIGQREREGEVVDRSTVARAGDRGSDLLGQAGRDHDDAAVVRLPVRGVPAHPDGRARPGEGADAAAAGRVHGGDGVGHEARRLAGPGSRRTAPGLRAVRRRRRRPCPCFLPVAAALRRAHSRRARRRPPGDARRAGVREGGVRGGRGELRVRRARGHAVRAEPQRGEHVEVARRVAFGVVEQGGCGQGRGGVLSLGLTAARRRRRRRPHDGQVHGLAVLSGQRLPPRCPRVVLQAGAVDVEVADAAAGRREGRRLRR